MLGKKFICRPLWLRGLVCIGSCTLARSTLISIVDFGAIPNDGSNEACYANSRAIENALNTANASGGTVLVPEGTTFHVFTSQLSSLHNVTFRIDGSLVISNNITEWSNQIRDFTAALNFLECRGLVLLGNGLVDGQGYDWWETAIAHKFNYHRPHMLWVYGSEDVEIHDLHFRNSPNFHCRIYDVHRLHIRNISIHVDVTAQQSMLQRFGHWLDLDRNTTAGGLPTGIPTFPLNTDGIDVNGYDVVIEDSTIENFDDAVVVKPSDNTSYWAPCSHSIVVRNCNVTYGVGMSIGSIGPSLTAPCIRNVTFENIRFANPLKAVYIKTNPGEVGTGSVDSITYRNLVIDGALWYPIWIGPQQMVGFGCSFTYPIAGACPTHPRITISNVLLIDVTSTGGLLLPGVLLGNATNPVRNLTFVRVHNQGGFIVRKDYVCEGVLGNAIDSSPAPSCFH